MKMGRFIQCLCIFLLISSDLSSQEILEVVTKKIEKTLDYSSDYRLNIEGERADVLINTWHETKVKVELTLLAKHRDLQVARQDIEIITYQIERRGKIIFIQNTMKTSEDADKPSSILQAHYVIT